MVEEEAVEADEYFLDLQLVFRSVELHVVELFHEPVEAVARFGMIPFQCVAADLQQNGVDLLPIDGLRNFGLQNVGLQIADLQIVGLEFADLRPVGVDLRRIRADLRPVGVDLRPVDVGLRSIDADLRQADVDAVPVVLVARQNQGLRSNGILHDAAEADDLLNEHLDDDEQFDHPGFALDVQSNDRSVHLAQPGFAGNVDQNVVANFLSGQNAIHHLDHPVFAKEQANFELVILPFATATNTLVVRFAADDFDDLQPKVSHLVVASQSNARCILVRFHSGDLFPGFAVAMLRLRLTE